jgi:predicted nuclease of predicted toxin-antitoxin system
MRAELNVDALSLKELGLRDAADREIFDRARMAGAVLMSKDSDFVESAQRFRRPPQLVWVTCGNVASGHE